MNYKKRTAESTQYPHLVDYLQGGILLHFNIQQTQREENNGYQYDEFWFSLDTTTEEIEAVIKQEGFVLTEDHKLLLK